MADRAIDPWSLAAIEQNRQWLTAFLLGASGDRAAADDLVQEVFKIAYEKRATFTPGTNFGGWLRVIAQNCLSRYFERTRRQPLLVGDAWRTLAEASVRTEERLLDPAWVTARLAALRQCMERLTARAKEILRRRYAEGRSAQEVAASFSMSPAAVHVAAFRARELLAQCVQQRTSHASRG
jgi:RNA polymerase sigma-70 factor (ECF subfamily)